MHVDSGTEGLYYTELKSSSQFYLKAHKMDQFFSLFSLIPCQFVTYNRIWYSQPGYKFLVQQCCIASVATAVWIGIHATHCGSWWHNLDAKISTVRYLKCFIVLKHALMEFPVWGITGILRLQSTWTFNLLGKYSVAIMIQWEIR